MSKSSRTSFGFACSAFFYYERLISREHFPQDSLALGIRPKF